MVKLLKNSWSQVTLSEYRQIKEIIDDEALSDVEKDVALIAVLAGVDEQEIWNLPIDEVQELRRELLWVNTTFDYPKKPKFKSIKIGDWDCYVLQDLQKMTYAQFVDFQTYIADLENKKAEILSVFFIPKGHKYGDGYDIAALQQAIRDNVDILTYNTVWFFFLRKYQASLNRTAIYSASMIKARAMIMRKKNPLRKKYMEMARLIRQFPSILG